MIRWIINLKILNLEKTVDPSGYEASDIFSHWITHPKHKKDSSSIFLTKSINSKDSLKKKNADLSGIETTEVIMSQSLNHSIKKNNNKNANFPNK